MIAQNCWIKWKKVIKSLNKDFGLYAYRNSIIWFVLFYNISLGYIFHHSIRYYQFLWAPKRRGWTAKKEMKEKKKGKKEEKPIDFLTISNDRQVLKLRNLSPPVSMYTTEFLLLRFISFLTLYTDKIHTLSIFPFIILTASKIHVILLVTVCLFIAFLKVYDNIVWMIKNYPRIFLSFRLVE